MKPRTQGDEAITWIEKWCVHPNGPRRGKTVVLTVQQIVQVRRLLDQAERPTLDAVMSSYLTLFYLAGPDHDSESPPLESDIFTTWNAASENLRRFIKREGEVVACPELGTAFPSRAA
jgi:hypothetical protein